MADEKKPDAPAAAAAETKPDAAPAPAAAAAAPVAAAPAAAPAAAAAPAPKPAAAAPAPPAPPKIPAPIPFHAQADRSVVDQHETSADGSRPNGSDRDWIGYAQQGGGKVPEDFGVFHSGKEEQDELM